METLLCYLFLTSRVFIVSRFLVLFVAFLACSAVHQGPGEGDRAPALLFMLCEACGAATEAESVDLSEVLGTLAGRSGFTVASSVLEVKGLCAACRAAGRTTAPSVADQSQEQS